MPHTVVCIDPGHPSETSKGASANGLSELHLNWVIANDVVEALKKDNIKCVLTKDTEDKFVTNRQRAEIANEAHAVLLLRLHCDIGGKSGVTLFYPNCFIEKEGVTGPPVAVQQSSRLAAIKIAAVLKQSLGSDLPVNTVKTDEDTYIGHKQGGDLTASVFSLVPTVLVEMCVLTNKKDDLFISSSVGQNLIDSYGSAVILIMLLEMIKI
jgi:N-acetylmuramoyl-L-alanine amidase